MGMISTIVTIFHNQESRMDFWNFTVSNEELGKVRGWCWSTHCQKGRCWWEGVVVRVMGERLVCWSMGWDQACGRAKSLASADQCREKARCCRLVPDQSVITPRFCLIL